MTLGSQPLKNLRLNSKNACGAFDLRDRVENKAPGLSTVTRKSTSTVEDFQMTDNNQLVDNNRFLVPSPKLLGQGRSIRSEKKTGMVSSSLCFRTEGNRVTTLATSQNK
jgi:hypothetical protein